MVSDASQITPNHIELLDLIYPPPKIWKGATLIEKKMGEAATFFENKERGKGLLAASRVVLLYAPFQVVLYPIKGVGDCLFHLSEGDPLEAFYQLIIHLKGSLQSLFFILIGIVVIATATLFPQIFSYLKPFSPCPVPIEKPFSSCPAPIENRFSSCPAPIENRFSSCPAPIENRFSSCPAPIENRFSSCPAPIEKKQKNLPLLVKKVGRVEEIFSQFRENFFQFKEEQVVIFAEIGALVAEGKERVQRLGEENASLKEKLAAGGLGLKKMHEGHGGKNTGGQKNSRKNFDLENDIIGVKALLEAVGKKEKVAAYHKQYQKNQREI